MSRCLSLLALSVVLVSTSAWANPIDAYGLSARIMGLGGAGTALSEGFESNYYNPAAVAATDSLVLELGYAFHQPSLTLNEADLEVDSSRGLHGGLVLSGTLFGHRVGASLGLFLPDQQVVRLRSLPQRQPRFVLYDNRPQRIFIAASLAFQIVGDLYLGAGMTFLASTQGELDISGDVRLFDADETHLLSGVDVALDSVRYASVGLLFRPGPWRVGLSFRDEFVLTMDIDVSVRGAIINDVDAANPEVLLDAASLVINSSNTNLFSPRQVSFGIGYEAQSWLVALDVSWLQWSRFPAPTARVGVTLDLGDVLDFAIPPVDEPIAPDFHDILVARVGAELTLVSSHHLRLDLRCGYFYEPSPAPQQPGQTNYVDTDKHGLSMGLGFGLSNLGEVFAKPIVIDLAFQSILMAERSYDKREVADLVGDYVASGHILGASLTTRFSF